MIYICYNASDKSFTASTNIKSVSEVTGIPYHKAYRMLSNGTGTVEHGEYIIGKTEDLLKGKQRIPDKKGEFDDFFNPLE